MTRNIFTILVFFIFIILSTSLYSSPRANLAKPTIAIIIDDMGYHYQRNKDAINLPGAVTLSFLPHTPHTPELARLAHKKNKEILLHLPMESIDHTTLDSGGIHLDMNQFEIQHTLRNNLAVVPHAVGFNNHMGSLVSQHPGHISAMMEVLSLGNLFVVDSFTTNHSVIQQIATEHWVPSIRRDVFLDNVRSTKAINRRFNQLLRIAAKNGIALAIAHPYPQTLKVLKRRLSSVNSKGFRLVPVSRLIKLDMQRFKTWRAFLSH